jgi:hypothetical protein
MSTLTMEFLEKIRARFRKCLKNVWQSPLEDFLPCCRQLLIYWFTESGVEIAMASRARKHACPAHGGFICPK